MFVKVFGLCCARKPGKMDTKELHEHVKTNLNTRRVTVSCQKCERWTIEGHKRRVTRKECKRLREEFEVGGVMAQNGLWNIVKKRMLRDRGAVPKEDGDLLREYQSIHEENFPSIWLREDVEGKEEERKRLNEEAEREESKSGK